MLKLNSNTQGHALSVGVLLFSLSTYLQAVLKWRMSIACSDGRWRHTGGIASELRKHPKHGLKC